MSIPTFTGLPDHPCTTVELAQLLSCNPETIRLLIAAGILDAVDVARPGSTRPSWRIIPEAVAEMYKRRGANKTSERVDRRPREWESELEELLSE